LNLNAQGVINKTLSSHKSHSLQYSAKTIPPWVLSRSSATA
jgi:hypothetical protein